MRKVLIKTSNLKCDITIKLHGFNEQIKTLFRGYKDKNTIAVQTYTEGGVKSLFVAKITFENNLFVHTNDGSYFSDEGADKYYTLALGKEWTGGDVFDDYC